MSLQEALSVAKERHDWLCERIKAKNVIGWDIEWDTRERDALAVILRMAGRIQ